MHEIFLQISHCLSTPQIEMMVILLVFYTPKPSTDSLIGKLPHFGGAGGGFGPTLCELHGVTTILKNFSALLLYLSLLLKLSNKIDS